MRVRPRSILFIVALLIVIVVGASCGSSTSSTTAGASTTGSASSSTTVAPSTATTAAGPAGKLVLGVPVDANTLDTLQVNTTNPEFTLLTNLFDTLVFRDNQMKIQPMLAETWELENDTTWVFHLRKGAKFQNGEPVDAKAVKYTFDRAMDPAQKSKDQTVKYVNLDRVEVVDDYTVKLITKAPAPAMLSRLTFMYIVPPEYYAKADAQTAATKPVGSGPYKLVEWVKNDHITLEANPDYWGGAPAIKTVIFRPIPEVGTRLAELQSGGIDIALAKSAETDSTAVKGIDGRRIYIGFHFGLGGPIDNKLVRQAINYAVDVDAICKNLLGGYTTRKFSLNTPADTSPNIKTWPYDPEKAKQLLVEAGYPNGFETVIDTPAGRYIKDKEVALAVADYLTKVGIKTTVNQYDWAEYVKILVPRKSGPMFLIGTSMYYDALTDITLLSYDNQFNAGDWNNTEFQDLLKQAGSTMDDAARKAIIFKAQELANDECPWLWMYFQHDLYGVSKKVEWTPRGDEYIVLSDAKLVK
jgi:peptide/nickel transport system substrate-binding protein